MGNPAPATTPQKSATQPCQTCPQKPYKPCDVDKLILEATGVKSDTDKGGTPRKLETVKVRRKEPVPRDVKSSELRRLLGIYDLIIDVIADPQETAKHDATPAKIKGQAHYHGRKCQDQAHAFLQLKALGKAPELNGKTEIVKKQPGADMLKMDEVQVFAKKSFIDYAPNQAKDSPFDEATNIFGIIKALWDAFDEKGVELRADGCGFRAKEDKSQIRKSLFGLVRIHRKSKWMVGIKIPPLGSLKAEREASINTQGVVTKTKSSEASAGYNYYKTEKKSEVSGEGVLANYSHTGKTQKGGSVSAYEQSRKVEDGSVNTTFKEEYSDRAGREMANQDGTITTKEIGDRLDRASGFDIVIAHNGTEVAALDALNRIKDMIKQITKVLTDVNQFLNKLPQMGWKFTFEVSVFAGKIQLEWWPDYIDKKLAGGRYYPVGWELKGSINMEVINASIGVSFGVDVRALGTGVVAKITGTLSLKVDLNKPINLNFFKPKQVFGVTTSADAKLEAVGYASVFGKTLTDANLTAGGGLELKGDLTLEWSSRTFDFKGKLKRKKTLLTGYIRVPIWPDKKIDPPVLILKDADLYTFS